MPKNVDKLYNQNLNGRNGSKEKLSVYRLSEYPPQKGRWVYWWRWLRLGYLRLISLRGQPEYLARGLAAGVFAGFFPFFGFQAIIGVAVAVILRGHKLLAVAGTWVSNPFTYVPLFFFNLKFGMWLLGIHQFSLMTDHVNLQSVKDFSELVETGAELAAVLLLGSTVMGLIAAIAIYTVSVPLFRYWQQKRSQRR
ncbi:MAG: DUF2062 domain-containing protein [Limnospira sp. PMC 1291.21]|uniref:DUF2062 domain-containing protein n=3 Tax=Limnospira TaxID=2596745 RepID=A0A9P1KBX1_9CYAN|nr:MULTISPECIES: DUF2062 domain-containing protein [Limnospira]EKD10530.1 hypothetical protein SPLC1_S082050 [Arthrospira platensis C1]MDC0840500.1 DUF2062 domain-containing protein [Limnoraphis robusta]MDY7055020.1 DUF2062 domain-containing protein [Limnospira fusiformis LS22]QJB28325.1 DUF2062 domain-containing protein [Limnospira fusiformis SAG 85.79]EDZ97072.1 conserved hypothetical protein [Limnospira maxima CS-328]